MAEPVENNEGVGHEKLTEQDLAEQQWRKACQNAEAGLSSCGESAAELSDSSEHSDASNSESAGPVSDNPWYFLSPSDCIALCVCSRRHWNRVAACTPLGQLFHEIDDQG